MIEEPLATLNLVREQINIFWMMRYTRTKERVTVYEIISMGRRFNKTIYGVADKTHKDRVGKSVSLAGTVKTLGVEVPLEEPLMMATLNLVREQI